MLKGSVQLGIMFSPFLLLLYIFFCHEFCFPEPSSAEWRKKMMMMKISNFSSIFLLLSHFMSSLHLLACFFLLTLLLHSALCVPLVHYENFIWKGPALVLGRKMGDCELNTRAQKKNETTKSRKGRSKWRTLNFWWFELNYWGGFFIDAGTNVIWSRRARSLTLGWGMGDEGEH